MLRAMLSRKLCGRVVGACTGGSPPSCCKVPASFSSLLPCNGFAGASSISATGGGTAGLGRDGDERWLKSIGGTGAGASAAAEGELLVR